jgi:hypothetical protein
MSEYITLEQAIDWGFRCTARDFVDMLTGTDRSLTCVRTILSQKQISNLVYRMVERLLDIYAEQTGREYDHRDVFLAALSEKQLLEHAGLFYTSTMEDMRKRLRCLFYEQRVGSSLIYFAIDIEPHIWEVAYYGADLVGDKAWPEMAKLICQALNGGDNE